MRYLGIDFGTKRIGIAISDDMATLAFPKMVLENNKTLLGPSVDTIYDMCKADGIETVVLGESKNFKGEDNEIMGKISKFKADLELKGLKVIYMPEIFSTVQAEQIQGKNKDLDASAAAVILQSYLDGLVINSLPDSKTN